MKTGDKVRIVYGDQRVDGVAMMVSANGNSLMLRFEAIIDGHVGMMPVLRQDGVYRSVVTGSVVEIIELPAENSDEPPAPVKSDKGPICALGDGCAFTRHGSPPCQFICGAMPVRRESIINPDGTA